MKKHIQQTLCVFVFLIIITPLRAIDATWIGGTGYWNNASNWDTGIVPVAGDHVFIESGTVRISNYSADAEHIKVSPGARIIIYSSGTLNVEDATNQAAIRNEGLISLVGALNISDVTSPNGYGGHGIYNVGSLRIYENASLGIIDVEDQGIDNRSGGEVINYGVIDIYEIERYHAINNYGNFVNHNSIILYATPGNTVSYGINNGGTFHNGTFYNNDFAEITCINGRTGFYNRSTGIFNNYGVFEIEDVNETGLRNYGTVENQEGSRIEITYAGYSGIANQSSGELINSGQLSASNSEYYGLRNWGTLTNNNFITLFGSGSKELAVYSGATLENQRIIHMTTNSTTYNLDVRGSFLNGPRGLLLNGGKMYISGTLDNEGYINLFYNGNHVLTSSGALNNYSVIDDNFGKLPSGTNNQKLIIAPYDGTMQVDKKSYNVFDVASLDGITIGLWKDSPSGTVSVGDYDASNNSFVPNSQAAGATTFYISVNNGSGFSRNHTLELSDPVQNIKSENTPQFNFGKPNEVPTATAQLSIYPNPSAGELTLQTKAFENAETQVQIWNTLGQMVWQKTISKGSSTRQLDLPVSIENGLYLIQLSQNGKSIQSKKLKVYK